MNVCTTRTTPNHYTNCNTCFGFGIYYSRGKNIPVDSYAITNSTIPPNAEKCPECGAVISPLRLWENGPTIRDVALPFELWENGPIITLRSTTPPSPATSHHI